MTGPDETTEARLRGLFRDAAGRIHPTRPAPHAGMSPPPGHRRAGVGLTIGVAVCVAVAATIIVGVRPWAGSGGAGLGSGAGPPGALLTAESDGAVELLSPATGAVLATLTGPSPVDTSGRHLGLPTAVTAADQVAYVAYERPSPVIESIPFAGGTPRYVTDGMYPSASPDGTRLALFRFGTGDQAGAVVVRDLGTGAEQTVDPTPVFTVVEKLSWSSDGTELALGGIFTATTPVSPSASPGGALGDLATGVQLLDLDQPLSGTNPRFLGTPTTISDSSGGPSTWTDAQFRGTGPDVAVLAEKPGPPCRLAPTTVLSVDPGTGLTTTIVGLPFAISDAVFDQAGDLIAFQRQFLPRPCPPVTTTTTTTTTVPGRINMGGASGGGSFGVSLFSLRPVLTRWSGGRATTLADDVVAVSFVPAPGDQAP